MHWLFWVDASRNSHKRCLQYMAMIVLHPYVNGNLVTLSVMHHRLNQYVINYLSSPPRVNRYEWQKDMFL